MLERMAAGEEVWSHYGSRGGAGPYAFWPRRITDRAPSMATIRAARDAGWLVDTNAEAMKSRPSTSARKWAITDAGRAAIA